MSENPAITDFERVLITGGSDFIGGSLVKSLVARGIRPLIADRIARESDTNSEYQIARIDVTDSDAVGKLVDDFQPDLVIHLGGAKPRVDQSEQGSDGRIYASSASLLRQLADSGRSKTVLMGTAAEYGDNPTPFREDMPLRPVSSYGVEMAKVTEFALGLHQQKGFNVTVLRTFTAYGPGQPANTFLSQLVKHAVRNQPFNMSDGTQLRDFVYIDDVVTALIAASVSRAAAGRVINIGTGRAIALREAAEFVWSACNADRQNLIFGSAEKTDDDPFDTMADINLASQVLGWNPVTSFEAGITKMIEAERTKGLERT